MSRIIKETTVYGGPQTSGYEKHKKPLRTICRPQRRGRSVGI